MRGIVCVSEETDFGKSSNLKRRDNSKIKFAE